MNPKWLGPFVVWLVAGALPLRAAVWEEAQSELPSGQANTSLGISGRTVVVDETGTSHVVFQSSGEQFEVLYATRNASGAWSNPTAISAPGENGRNASVALGPDGRIHVVWEDVTSGSGDIVHRTRETDGTWLPAVTVSPAPGVSKHPVITVDAFNRPHTIWVDGRTGVEQIVHAVMDEGAWSAAEIVSSSGVAPKSPNLVADGLGVVHLVWADRASTTPNETDYNIYYVAVNADLSLGAVVPLVAHAGTALRPFLESEEDGTLHLVWLDDRSPGGSGAYEIFYKRFLPGVGWGKDKRFSYDRTDHGRPVIVRGPSRSLNLAWEDYRSGNPDIYYRQITWETGWDRRPTRLTADNSSSQSPALVASSDGRLTLFWTDAQGSGTFRVYAKDGLVSEGP